MTIPHSFRTWLHENALISSKIKAFIQGQRIGSVVSVGKMSFVLAKISHAYLYKRMGAMKPYLYRFDWNPDGTVSVRQARLDGKGIGDPVVKGPAKRVSDPPKKNVTEAASVTYTQWVAPVEKDLRLEYMLEYEKKPELQRLTKNAWPTADDFVEAANAAIRAKSFLKVTPEIDRRIAYRSHTPNKASLRSLISTYASWGKFRTDETLNNLYARIENNQPLTMPIVVRLANGSLRIMGGNTRMDVAAHLGVHPTVLVVPVPHV